MSVLPCMIPLTDIRYQLDKMRNFLVFQLSIACMHMLNVLFEFILSSFECFRVVLSSFFIASVDPLRTGRSWQQFFELLKDTGLLCKLLAVGGTVQIPYEKFINKVFSSLTFAPNCEDIKQILLNSSCHARRTSDYPLGRGDNWL